MLILLSDGGVGGVGGVGGSLAVESVALSLVLLSPCFLYKIYIFINTDVSEIRRRCHFIQLFVVVVVAGSFGGNSQMRDAGC